MTLFLWNKWKHYVRVWEIIHGHLSIISSFIERKWRTYCKTISISDYLVNNVLAFAKSTFTEQIFKPIFCRTRRELLIDHDIHMMKHFVTYFLCYTFSSVYSYMYKYRKSARLISLSSTDSWFLKVFKFLQCYHQAYIVFHCLGYWNELVSDWHQLFKVLSKEFLFFCYFERMNDF